MRTNRRANGRLPWQLFTAVASITIAVTACGNDDSDGQPATSDGRQIAISAGCAGCHGGKFTGASGPSWVGLAGSNVELADGTSVAADRIYLAEAIRNPGAQRVAGYTVTMPTNTLTDEQIDLIVDYIETLASPRP